MTCEREFIVNHKFTLQSERVYKTKISSWVLGRLFLNFPHISYAWDGINSTYRTFALCCMNGFGVVFVEHVIVHYICRSVVFKRSGLV
jgi:hypothetical protein